MKGSSQKKVLNKILPTRFLLDMYRYARTGDECYYIKYLPISKRKIVFNCFSGRKYGDNPKYIVEEIHRQNLDWDMVWLTRDMSESLPSYVRPVEYGSAQARREITTAKIYVMNKRSGVRVSKRKGQIYLQTWHGGLGFKKVEAEAEGKLDERYVNAAKRDGAECDAIISACALQSIDYKKHFWLNSRTKILEFGQPRCDALFQNCREAIVEKVYTALNISEDMGIILYAPTFRDDWSMDCYKFDYNKVLDVFEKKYSRKYVMVVRLHPNIQHLCGFLHYNDRIINGSGYPDIQELFLASGFLISDYSSAVFDFALLNKPVFLYVKDWENYEKLRGFTEVFHNCPFPKAYSEEQMLSLIDAFNHDKYMNEFIEFKDTVWRPFDDGHASERTVNWLKNYMGKI